MTLLEILGAAGNISLIVGVACLIHNVMRVANQTVKALQACAANTCEAVNTLDDMADSLRAMAYADGGDEGEPDVFDTRKKTNDGLVLTINDAPKQPTKPSIEAN